MVVFVLSSGGSFVQHGPRRSSEKQAQSVAKLLARRLGWVCVVADVAPPVPDSLPDGLPSEFLAGLSPVWKDPDLAARWAAAGRARVVAPAIPVVEFNPDIEALGLGN